MTVSEEHCSPEIGELAKAMVKVQQALNPACKDAQNPFVKNRYASLNSVIEASREALAAQSVWVAQYPVGAESDHLALVTKLVHAESGQWQSSLMVMPLPKNDPQGYGSALTYARRYGLATLVGMVSEIDDDGISAMPEKAQKPVQVLSESPDQILAGLPRLDGVTYRTMTANDGRLCITASGNTQSKKAFLQECGFRWDGKRKLWWRYAQNQAA